MKNILKRNSRKVNVSNCGTLDCTEKQPEKEVEIYKTISEDTAAKALNNSTDTKNKEEEQQSESSETPVKEIALKEEKSTTDTKMVQEENNANDGADERMLGGEDNEKLAGKREEVKFIKGDHQNGDAKIDIGGVNGAKGFTGMTKEELMKYANDPFWVRLRWIFFISFWLVWLGMLVGAILIIIDAPKCAAPDPLPWYKRGVLAKFPDFKVNNDDVELASQMKASGVIYEMPAALTYKAREADVEEIIKSIVNQYKDSNMHVILDITPNYVSKSSKLMQEALQNETKRSAFVWVQNAEVPNNWLSLVNGTAWDEVTPGNYVLSQFGDGLYDLHMNDSIVKEEFSDVLRHVVDLGVRGIRLKNTKFFILSKNFKDESVAKTNNYDLDQYGFWTHSQTTFQEGLGNVLDEYRTVVKNNSDESFLSVADDILRPQIYEISNDQMGIDIPIYGQFVKDLAAPEGKNLRSQLLEIFKEVDNSWVQWNVGDLGENTTASNQLAAYLFLSLLPGTPVLSVGSKVHDNINKTVFKEVEKWRLSPSYMHGDFELLNIDPLVGYTRIKSGSPGFLVVYNPTEINQQVNLGNGSFPETMTVQAVSNNLNGTLGGKIPIADLKVPSLSTIVLSYVPVKTD